MMHELPLQENGDNLEEQHFTTALTLMAEVETEQSLKMRVNPSGIPRLAGDEATVSGSTFKIKAAHREVTTGALLAWRGTTEPVSPQCWAGMVLQR